MGVRLYSRKVMTGSDLRTLWLQLAGWTRLYIIGAGAGLADAEQTGRRLLKACDDMAAYVKEYYFYADEFKKLLKEHANLTMEMEKCIRQGNSENIEKVREKWRQAAEEMAEWCCRFNPYWKMRDWQPALMELVSLTERAIRLYASKDIKAYMECFDLLDNQAAELADIMFEGIVAHFNIIH